MNARIAEFKIKKHKKQIQLLENIAEADQDIEVTKENDSYFDGPYSEHPKARFIRLSILRKYKKTLIEIYHSQK